MIALALVALLQAAAAPAAPAGSPPQVSWTVSPDSVTVAERFTVTITVQAPADLSVVFPPGPDSAQTVEAVDPPAITVTHDSTGAPVRSATYRLVAWETGAQAVPLTTVLLGSGPNAQRADIQPQVFVRSVLPADTAKRVPRPALGVLAAPRLWWPFALAALLAVALLLWLRRARRRRAAAAPPPSALAVAQAALARVDALGLLEAGEPSRYVALCADALRGYLSARADVASRAQTTTELLDAIRGHGLPLERISAVLAEADQAQFARRTVSTERAKEVAREVRAVLEACDEHFARSIPMPPGRAA